LAFRHIHVGRAGRGFPGRTLLKRLQDNDLA